MTVLYRLDTTARQMAAAFGARANDDPWSGGHVSPGQFAPVITAGREFIAGPRPAGKKLESRMIPRIWGVPPLQSTMEPIRHGITTVRNPGSPFWIGNLRNAEFRCLVPATAFMEWGKGRDRDGRRMRHWFTASDQPVFLMAGVWKDSEVPSFALMTCEPNALLRAAGRDAMPVVLPADPKARDTWLHGNWNRASELLVPYSSSLMKDVALS